MALKRALREIGRLTRKLIRRRGRVLSFPPHASPDRAAAPGRRALVSYITRAFDAPGGAGETHTNLWECRQIVETFRLLGYGVDVIDWDDRRFTPRRQYDFFLDIGSNLERLTPLLGAACVKILHATGKHWLFQNRAEYERLAGVLARRGVALEPRRIAPGGQGVEVADCLTVLGNEGTLDTLRYAGKPLYRIPLSTTTEFPWNDRKDFSDARRRFLWLGSSGMVHKGLDLVLEAFAATPELELVVCGPVKHEPDFERLYQRELYETPNIETVGWVDVASPRFADIAGRCGALVYPSCSEGCAGSVVTCLHAGLAPIVSRESGVDVDGFGLVLLHSTIDCIQSSARQYAALSPAELRDRAHAAWTFARREHTRARFAEEFLSAIRAITRTG